MLTPESTVNYATRATEEAYSFMNQLGLTTSELAPPVITPVFPSVAAAPVLQTTAAPELQTATITTPNVPAPLAETININDLLPDTFDEAPPTLFFGTAPASFTDRAPDAPGVDLSYVMPELSVSLPAAPNLLSIQTRKFDGVTLPTIADDVPELIAVAPSIVEYKPGELYASSLLTGVQTTLLDRIQNGGTGLPPAAENAIWDRAREREFLNARDAIDDLDRMESLGYAFPPGVYMNARYKINTEMRARNNGLNREIMIKQAELELENIKQSLTLAVQLEGTMVNYANQVAQRLFESSKYATEAGIEIYNAKVRAYAAFLDAYKTKVAIYEARIRGELAKVEAYKAEIQAEEAKAQINTALVNQFKVKTDAALSAVEVFKAQVLAIQSKAEIEKLKISVFGEQVRAFTAKIGAYTAGVEGFKASIQAEASKQEAYKAQVSAYSAKVDAAVKAAQARIEEYKGKIAAKTAEWEGYKAAYAGEAAKVNAIAATNSAIVDGYKAEVGAVSSYNDVLTRQWQAAIDQSQKVAEIGVSAAKANADLYTTTRSLAVDAAKVGSQVAAQVASAALNAVNFNYSNAMSYSGSESNSTSNSAANSRSDAASFSELFSVSSSYSQSVSV
jgi:hypothetical protein